MHVGSVVTMVIDTAQREKLCLNFLFFFFLFFLHGGKHSRSPSQFSFLKVNQLFWHAAQSVLPSANTERERERERERESFKAYLAQI